MYFLGLTDFMFFVNLLQFFFFNILDFEIQSLSMTVTHIYSAFLDVVIIASNWTICLVKIGAFKCRFHFLLQVKIINTCL